MAGEAPTVRADRVHASPSTALTKYLWAAALLTVGVATLPAQQPGPAAPIRAALQRMSDAWNAGNLAGHVAPYADSATMMTTNGLIVGRDTIAAHLRRGYWKNGKPGQQLRFEDLVVRSLGADYALSTGRFVLFGGGKPEASGHFSLVWQRIDGRWRIIHDHSS